MLCYNHLVEEITMKIRWNHRYVQLGVTAFLVIAASILFYYGIFHMKSLITGIKTFFGIMAPIIYGAAIAYLLTPIVNFLERKIIFPIFEKRNKALQKKGRKVVRWICVILSVFLMFLVIYALVMMILPQLIRSIMNIIYSFPHYVSVVENWLNSVVEKGWKLNPANWQGLSFETLDAIQKLTGDMPLVLHGGTGIPADMIKKAISLGVSKINVNTECQLAFAEATRKYIEEGKDQQGKGYDPRKLLAPGIRKFR